jgi:hypothetical protein
MTPPLVLSALCLALCLCFFLYVRWYIRRNTAIDQLLGEYRSEVFRLIAEIDAATDRDSQLVEDRIQTLKSLLADTDKRIAVYVRELERSKNGEALYSSLGRGVRSALRQGQPETAKPAPAGERTAPAAEPAPAAEQPPPAPALPVKKRPARSPHSGEAPAELFENTPASPLRLQAQIAALAAEGHSPSLIASRLNIDRSEVELALNLRNWK